MEDERTPADGPDREDRADQADPAVQAVDDTDRANRADPAEGPHQADPADGPHQPDQPDQAVDDTIRLTWREKLVEFGMLMALVMCGTVIGMIVIIAVLLTMSSTIEEWAPGFTEAGSIPFILLVVVAVIIGNVCSFSCAPYLIRLLFRGNELKDERMDRAVKHLMSVTGMDIRVERIYAIKSKTANAVVAGLFRKAQCIFFTNRLLERMSEGEIMAALAHELAHARHRHMTKMLVAIVLWALGVQVFFRLIDFHAYFGAQDVYWKIWANGVLNGLNVFLLLLLVLFPLSRRHEYQADATAALWVGTGLYKQTLYRIHQINDKLKPPRKFLAKVESHPTLQERLERVERLE